MAVTRVLSLREGQQFIPEPQTNPALSLNSTASILKQAGFVIGENWILIVLGFNDTSTLEGHFVSSPREREKRDRRESRGDERKGQGRKRNRKESEETEEIKTFPLYPYPLQG